VVIGNLKTLSPEQAQRWGLDVEQQKARAEVFRQRSPLPPQLWAQVFERPAAATPVDVDEDLYGGFVGNADRQKLNALRAAPPHELALREPPFEDARLSELVFRWRARNFPHTLDEGERARWEKHRTRRLHEGQGGVTTLAAYAERIDALSETADERGQEILGALYDWAEEIAP
jgi:exodeoxyribonuclease-1